MDQVKFNSPNQMLRGGPQASVFGSNKLRGYQGGRSKQSGDHPRGFLLEGVELQSNQAWDASLAKCNLLASNHQCLDGYLEGGLRRDGERWGDHQQARQLRRSSQDVR